MKLDYVILWYLLNKLIIGYKVDLKFGNVMFLF